MSEFLQNLLAAGTSFAGRGTNHEGESFVGELSICGVFAGVALSFRAVGSSGEVFHDERVLIGPAAAGGLQMTSLNSNMPFLQLFASAAPGSHAASFIHGDLSDLRGFRERVTFNVDEDAITYAFFWGMSGEEVLPRSRVTMRAVQLQQPARGVDR